MEFNIGDRIMVKDNGLKGVIVDRFKSDCRQAYLYRIRLDGYESAKTTFFEESELVPEVVEKATYHFEFDYAENLVAVRFYEDKGDKSTIIGRGHGHVFHDGAVGVAQAASYALKRILEKLNDGYCDLRKTENKEKRR